MLFWAACTVGSKGGDHVCTLFAERRHVWEGTSTAGGGSEGSGAIFFPLIIYHTAMFSSAEVDGPGTHMFRFSAGLPSDLLPNVACE